MTDGEGLTYGDVVPFSHDRIPLKEISTNIPLRGFAMTRVGDFP